MFQFIGYSFFSDDNCLNSAPSSVDNITITRLANAIFDHFNVSDDMTLPEDTTIPANWNYETILDADFNGNISGGNIDFLLSQVTAIKIKRRKKGEFDWITLTTIPINSLSDLTFVYNDRIAAGGVEYEYAFVPIMNNVEGEYIINTILSNFNGVFIADADTTYKFIYELAYGSNQRNQQIGTFQVLGKQYPVIVANGELSYETGSFSSTILNDDFSQTGVIDRAAITEKKDQIKDFLTNRKPKILKDFNGNIWLVIITSNVTVTYKSSYGMGIPQLAFNWTEIGDATSESDLKSSGLITE